MFNALNRFMSRLDGDQSQRRNDHGSYGFQVLRNTNLELAVEPWFDFIVGINGRAIEDPNPSLFAQEVQNCAGGVVSLGLWNAKGQRTRELHATVAPDTASLGLTLQYSALALAANIWHVLDVAAKSPADQGGLLPYSDYILGSPEGSLQGESALGELVEDHIGRPLRLYVYNNEYNVTREVTIHPSRGWGGEGVLGCVLGYGALHRLPAPLTEPVSAPGETMFDGMENEKAMEPSVFVPADASASSASGSTGADFLIPAQMMASGSKSPPPPPPRRSAATAAVKKKDRQHGANNHLMDEYFKEEEKKSRDADNAPSSKASGVPPPPKAGAGPPKAETSTGE
ncbi:hypothetical protein E4U42_003348 [Claviceps africana]|uniref:PDZ GRASP-type domain-containing protein n=1 Tax=Claviceps africana TaxID=83212 RepID=A0A8K0NJ32_9HYPO|nr:hypothetical protein E4U42_003348 [Claviceps africana]